MISFRMLQLLETGASPSQYSFRAHLFRNARATKRRRSCETGGSPSTSKSAGVRGHRPSPKSSNGGPGNVPNHFRRLIERLLAIARRYFLKQFRAPVPGWDSDRARPASQPENRPRAETLDQRVRSSVMGPTRIWSICGYLTSLGSGGRGSANLVERLLNPGDGSLPALGVRQSLSELQRIEQSSLRAGLIACFQVDVRLRLKDADSPGPIGLRQCAIRRRQRLLVAPEPQVNGCQSRGRIVVARQIALGRLERGDDPRGIFELECGQDARRIERGARFGRRGARRFSLEKGEPLARDLLHPLLVPAR